MFFKTTMDVDVIDRPPLAGKESQTSDEVFYSHFILHFGIIIQVLNPCASAYIWKVDWHGSEMEGNK